MTNLLYNKKTLIDRLYQYDFTTFKNDSLVVGTVVSRH